MKVEGHTYKPNAAVLCGIAEDVFEVIIISSIYVNNDKIFFKGNVYSLTTYNRHYRAHILSITDKEKCVSYNALIHHIPPHSRMTRVLQKHTIVILPFYISQ